MKWQLQNLNSEQRQAGARAALSALLLAVSLLVAMPSLLKDSLLLVAPGPGPPPAKGRRSSRRRSRTFVTAGCLMKTF